MIDYLIAFPTAEARNAAFPAPEESPFAPCWPVFEDGTAMPVRIIVADAAMSEDGETVVTPPIIAPGHWIALRTTGRVGDIENMTECELCTDSELAAAGEPYVHFCRLEPTTILGQVSPVFAGDAYPIPVGEPAEALEEWMVPTT